MARETAISPSHIVFISRLMAFLETEKYSSIAQMKILIPISHNWEKCSVMWEKLCKLIQKLFSFLKTLWAKLRIGLFQVELFKLWIFCADKFSWIASTRHATKAVKVSKDTSTSSGTNRHLWNVALVCGFPAHTNCNGTGNSAFTRWMNCRYPSTSNPQSNHSQYPVNY